MRYPFGLRTALIALGIEEPRTTQPPSEKLTVVVSNHNQRSHVKGLNFAVWNAPIVTVSAANGLLQFTSPACIWVMMSARLTDIECIALAESMMRRDPQLKRTTLDELWDYIQLAEAYKEDARNKRTYVVRGIGRCKRVFPLLCENTDSSQEGRTRITLVEHGLGCPIVNYKLALPDGTWVLLDMAFPKVKIAIEYDGQHHAGQWLQDSERRNRIEDAGWIFIQVTKLDLATVEARYNLACRVAKKIEERLGIPVFVLPAMTIQQSIDYIKNHDLPWL